MDDKLIQSMVASHNELLKRLIADRDEIEDEINRVKGDLLALKSGSTSSLEPRKRIRRPRGVNRRDILSIFDGNPTKEFMVADITKQTQISPSSVGAVLKKLVKENAIEQTLTGMWRKKPVLTSE